MRAFWLTWLAFVLASTAGAIILTIGYWVMEAIWPSPGDDMPPLLAVLSMVGALVPACVLGFVVAMLRRAIVRPRFPYVSWGWLGVIAAPLGLAALAPSVWNAPLLNPIDAEVWLLVTLPLFIWLGLRLHAFADSQASQPDWR